MKIFNTTQITAVSKNIWSKYYCWGLNLPLWIRKAAAYATECKNGRMELSFWLQELWL